VDTPGKTEYAWTQVELKVMKAAVRSVGPASANIPNAPGLAEFIVPRHDPIFYLGLLEKNVRLQACIRAAARSAVGLGATAVLPEHVKRRVQDRRNKQQFAYQGVERLQQLIDKPNTVGLPFAEVTYQAEYDSLSSGNGWIEVVEEGRAAGALPLALLHCPTPAVRIHRTGDKYVRAVTSGAGINFIYFKRFGDSDPTHRYINRRTGEWYASRPANLTEDELGTALIHIRRYTPLDDYYGEPVSVPALAAVTIHYLAELWNVRFLQNNANVPFAVIVRNGNLSDTSMEQLQLFAGEEAAGIKNTGHVIVLQPNMDTVLQGNDTNIDIKELKLGLTDDGSFIEISKMSNAAVQEAVGVASIFIGGASDATRAVAIAAKQSTVEQTFEPRTRLWEALLQPVAAQLGTEAVVKFNRTRILDDQQYAGIAAKLAKNMSVNELRALINVLLRTDLQPAEGDDADRPMQLVEQDAKKAQAEAQAKAQAAAAAAAATAQNQQEPSSTPQGDNPVQEGKPSRATKKKPVAPAASAA